MVPAMFCSAACTEVAYASSVVPHFVPHSAHAQREQKQQAALRGSRLTAAPCCSGRHAERRSTSMLEYPLLKPLSCTQAPAVSERGRLERTHLYSMTFPCRFPSPSRRWRMSRWFLTRSFANRVVSASCMVGTILIAWLHTSSTRTARATTAMCNTSRAVCISAHSNLWPGHLLAQHCCSTTAHWFPHESAPPPPCTRCTYCRPRRWLQRRRGLLLRPGRRRTGAWSRSVGMATSSVWR